MVFARLGHALDPPANELPRIRAFYQRMLARPAVARVVAREGINPQGPS